MLAFNPDSRPSASDSLRHPCFTAGKRASGQAESHAGGEQTAQSSPSAAVPQSGAGGGAEASALALRMAAYAMVRATAGRPVCSAACLADA